MIITIVIAKKQPKAPQTSYLTFIFTSYRVKILSRNASFCNISTSPTEATNPHARACESTNLMEFSLIKLLASHVSEQAWPGHAAPAAICLVKLSPKQKNDNGL